MVAAVAVATSAGAVRDAAASCTALVQLQAPADGSGGAPLNTEILRVGARPSGPAVLLQDGEEIATLAVEVVRDTGVESLYRHVLPAGLLLPLTNYTLRFGAPPELGQPDQRVETSFTTSADHDLAAPPRPEIQRWRLAHARMTREGPNGSEATAIELAFGADPDASAYETHLTGPGVDERYTMLAGEVWRFVGWGCGSPWVELQPGEEYCVTVRARDLAGNVSSSSSSCARVRQCPPFDPLLESGDLFECEEVAPQDADGEADGGCAAAAPRSGLALAGLIVLAFAAALGIRRRGYPRRGVRVRAR